MIVRISCLGFKLLPGLIACSIAHWCLGLPLPGSVADYVRCLCTGL